MLFGFLTKLLSNFLDIYVKYIRICAIVMGILAVAKIVPSLVLLEQTVQLRETVEMFINNVFDNPNLNETFHVLEALLKCCGTTGPDVYHRESVPPACCDFKEGIPASCLMEDAYQHGCATLIGAAVEKWSTYLAYLFIFIIAGEIVTLVVASYVVTTFKNKLS